MSPIVGFTAVLGGPEDSLAAATAAQQRALGYFDHLERQSLEVGETRLELWGHGQLTDYVHTLPDGAVLAVVGSPHGEVAWPKIEERLAQVSRAEEFELPWDGRVILLRVSGDGRRWTMWNDWLGSIPIFHSQVGRGRIASTLEPVVVAAAGFSPDDIFLPGLVSLMINGHYFSDWTLYKDMKVVPPDCVAEWDAREFRWKQLWTVAPSTERWETGWDELVDEMYELSRQAIIDAMRMHPTWILPLSAGLDSRLIAAVAAETGADVYTYSWGSPEATDVVYARQIANALGLPWKRIDIGTDYLIKYTPWWADWYGSSLHFHGMYQMSFLDALRSESAGPVLSGFVGDVLSGDSVDTLPAVHSSRGSFQFLDDGYTHWSAKEIEALFMIPMGDALEEIASAIQTQIDTLPGAWFQRLTFLELWSRQRYFTNFQSTLSDYWRGTVTPFVGRAYARFCLSIPRIALDGRRLLRGVYRRHYGLLATIPGTYGQEPFVRTGRYLLKRRIAGAMPRTLRRGPLRGMDFAPLRMDVDCVRATGRASLWPLFDAWASLAEWLDVGQVSAAYEATLASREDIKPLRKLQSVQTLAYRLLHSQNDMSGDPQ